MFSIYFPIFTCHLKKVLALVLAFACAFTMFASAAFTDQADIKATDAVDMLVALGVVDGFEDGSFQPNGTVTRAQMAKMIYVLRTGNSDASAYNDDKTSFTDIGTHWARGYIKYCQSLNIIAGKSNTKFDPNGKVTAQEAAKMLLVTLGYNAEKAGLVGSNWASKTNALADENGLLKDVNTSFTAACPRQYAAQLLNGDGLGGAIQEVSLFLNEESLHGNLRTGGALSAKSIKNMRVVLDVCCKRAVADGMMPANPVAATVYTHCRSKKHNIMSDSDQKVLEKWLFSDLSLNNAGIILALYSGMRLGEVCAARWGNYDAMSGTLHITQTVRRVMVDPAAEYGKRTKLIFSSAKSDASERDLYLPEVLQGLLTVQYQRFESLFKRMPNADDFIIYNTVGGVMDPDHLSSYWGDVLDGLGLPHVRFHDIRHTFATRAIEQGIDVATVAGLLGHADVTTTTHYYVHPRDASMRKAMAAVAPVGAVTHAWQNTRLFAPKSAEEKVPEAARRVHRRRKHIAECG